MKRTVFMLAVAGLLAMPAMATDYYLAGDYNGWDAGANLMDEITVDAYYTLDVTASGNQNFKATDGTWDNSWPAANVEAWFGDTDNTIEMRFWPGTFDDGWSPGQNRLGYEWLGLHGWEVMGSFNGWSEPVVTLNDDGTGVFSAIYTVADPGTYDFKYRMTDNWDTSIGDLDFGGDLQVTTTEPNEKLYFAIDMANGRYKVPEPTSLALLALGLLLRRR